MDITMVTAMAMVRGMVPTMVMDTDTARVMEKRRTLTQNLITIRSIVLGGRKSWE